MHFQAIFMQNSKHIQTLYFVKTQNQFFFIFEANENFIFLVFICKLKNKYNFFEE